MSVGLTKHCDNPRCSESIHVSAESGAKLAHKLRGMKHTKKGDLKWYCPRCAKRLARKQRYANRNRKAKGPRKAKR